MNKKFLIKNLVVILTAVIAIAFVLKEGSYDKAPIIFIVILAALGIWFINWKPIKNMVQDTLRDRPLKVS